MIINNPHNKKILKERLNQIETILNNISSKHCFISGSFLYNKNYKDIDVFIISRSKNKFNSKDLQINIIDFNKLHSLFYHSVSKSSISKDFLPEKELKVTITDYWNIINETIPSIFNKNKNFQKEIRSLILYTEYFRNGYILDSYELTEKVNSFKSIEQIITYIQENVPLVIKNKLKSSYLKKFFYTQSGHYKKSKEYSSHKFLYLLSKEVANG